MGKRSVFEYHSMTLFLFNMNCDNTIGCMASYVILFIQTSMDAQMRIFFLEMMGVPFQRFHLATAPSPMTICPAPPSTCPHPQEMVECAQKWSREKEEYLDGMIGGSLKVNCP